MQGQVRSLLRHFLLASLLLLVVIPVLAGTQNSFSSSYSASTPAMTPAHGSTSALANLFSHQANTEVVGSLSGKFSVNENGNAEYDIPLSTPPGTAQLTPKLSLHYDSGAGNGLLGMGFELEGLTAISRAPQD